MTKRLYSIFVVFALFALGACTVIPPAPPPSQAGHGQPPMVEPAPSAIVAALGETVEVDGPRVTPLEVLEDSRCPMNARCVWAGRVRLKLRIETGAGSEVREISSEEPIQVADGKLELVSVTPDRVAGADGPGGINPAAYRFGFHFAGGL